MSTLPPPEGDPLFNPYAAPKAEIGAAVATGLDASADDEAIRRKYLSHEASVKAVGWLNQFGGVVSVIGGVALVGLAIGGVPFPMPGAADPQMRAFLLGGLGAFVFALGILSYFVGSGLRRLRPWARTTEAILMAMQVLLSLVQLNIGGLLFPSYFLYLMLSRKSTTVFSPEYQEIVARTPHIKYKTSWIVKLLLIILVMVLVLAVVGGIFSARQQARPMGGPNQIQLQP